MTSILLTLVILAILVLTPLAGYKNGAFFSMYALVRNTFAFIAAMTFCVPLARLFDGLIGGDYPAHDYYVLISFGLAFGIVFAVSRDLKVRFTIPDVSCPIMVDKIAGPVIGIFGAIVATGSLLVFVSLLPTARFIPGDAGRMQVKFAGLDTGVAMLHFYNYVEDRMGGGLPFLLDDEPLIYPQDGQMVNGDLNGNGRWDALGETFSDTNNNKVWDRGWLWKYRNYGMIDKSDLEGVLGPQKDWGD